MSYFIKAWVTGSLINGIETASTLIIVNNIRNQRSEIIITAEIEGDYQEAGELMPLLSVANSVLTGVAIVSQAYELNTLIPLTVEEILTQKRATATLSRREFFLGLDAIGAYDTVMNATLPRTAKIELDTATSFERNWPTLINMAVQLGFTDLDLDQLFGI